MLLNRSALNRAALRLQRRRGPWPCAQEAVVCHRYMYGLADRLIDRRCGGEKSTIHQRGSKCTNDPVSRPGLATRFPQERNDTGMTHHHTAEWVTYDQLPVGANLGAPYVSRQVLTHCSFLFIASCVYAQCILCVLTLMNSLSLFIFSICCAFSVC